MLEHTLGFRVEVDFPDDLLTALAAVRTFAKQASLSPLTASRLITVTSELTTNLLKYSSGGVLTGGFCDATRRVLFVEAIDSGPGIADVEAAMQDHFSTGGSLGMGLPGVRRLANHFEIQSELGKGTRVRCEIQL